MILHARLVSTTKLRGTLCHDGEATWHDTTRYLIRPFSTPPPLHTHAHVCMWYMHMHLMPAKPTRYRSLVFPFPFPLPLPFPLPRLTGVAVLRASSVLARLPTCYT